MLTPKQKTRWMELYEEVQRSSSLLRHSVVLDLETGSVKIGKVIRNNPPCPKDEVDDGIQEMFIGMYRGVPPPYEPAPSTFDPQACDIVWVKKAALYYLS